MATKTTTRNRIAGNGADRTAKDKDGFVVRVEIPALQQGEATLMLIGDRPLLVNNKLNVAQGIAEQYGGVGGKAGTVKKPSATPDEQYAHAFYTLLDSNHAAPHEKARYGVPVSGIKKCACSAIRTTGITDNTTIGLIAKSFWVLGDSGGLCLLKYDRLERDVRPVNIGSGQKTVPQMRYRPMFHGWSIRLRVKFNRMVITEDQLVNLFMHAGQYIGLCEMRAEKKQGECGGFVVEGSS